MNLPAKRWLFPLFIAIAAFGSDQLSKGWAESNLLSGQSKDFIPGLIRFTLTHNTGAAFGIGRGQSLYMTAFAMLIICGLLFWIYKREKSDNPPAALERAGLALIVGAALANLYDRFSRGQVTDFLEFEFISFPIFNLADALIDLGAGFLILGGLLPSGQKSKPESEPEPVLDSGEAASESKH